MRLLEPLFRWDAVEELFSDRSRLQGLLDFEAALARAEGRSGVIPASAAVVIPGKCRAELFDIDALARAAALAGNPAIPVVKQLTALVAESDREAARFVHWGATSQDAMDTGFVLQLRAALDCITTELEALSGALATLTEKHRASVVVARTWMQQALPTVLGLKFAGWLDAIDRHHERLREVRRRALVVQFGGAVGTLAALGEKGIDVTSALAEELGLGAPGVPWHTHRDRVAEVATTLALLAGTLGKMARDISLHMQTEVGELLEPAGEGRGGSSTMPHKRNPVTSAVVLAAAIRVPGLVATMLSAMLQEQERGLGGWHAEWETIPEIIGLTAGALHHLSQIIPRLGIDECAMRANLEVTQGLIFAEPVQMALGSKIGRQTAHELVEAACRCARSENRQLRQVLAEDNDVNKHLDERELDRLFDPRQYLGVADQLIARVLAAHSASRSKTVRESE